MEKLPGAYTRLRENHPAIAEAYDRLGSACMEAGPLDAKTRALVKLGISIGGRLEGAVHAHARKALRAGASPDELRHAALLAMTTAGFPSAVAATSWIEEVVAEQSAPRGDARER